MQIYLHPYLPKICICNYRLQWGLTAYIIQFYSHRDFKFFCLISCAFAFIDFLSIAWLID